MIIERETMKRFVRMLYAHQIIVIQCTKPRLKNYCYKFIGADAHGRYDFTPLVAEYSGWRNNGSTTIEYLSIRSTDGAAVIVDTLDALREDGIFKSKKTNYDLYEEVRHLLCTFYV